MSEYRCNFWKCFPQLERRLFPSTSKRRCRVTPRKGVKHWQGSRSLLSHFLCNLVSRNISQILSNAECQPYFSVCHEWSSTLPESAHQYQQFESSLSGSLSRVHLLHGETFWCRLLPVDKATVMKHPDWCYTREHSVCRSESLLSLS